MAAITSFQRRLDDMHDSTPKTLKRKIWSYFSTPSPSGQYDKETHLLDEYEKRMKLNQWEPVASTRANLLPASVQLLQDADERDKYSRGSFSHFTQFSAQPVPSAGGSATKALTLSNPVSPYVLPNPDTVHSEILPVPRSSDSLSSAWLGYYGERDSLYRGVKDWENEVLRQILKAERKANRDAMEALERATAAQLKQQKELENFKRMVYLNQQNIERAEGISILLGEDQRVTGISSVSSPRGMSLSGSQPDEENGPSGSKDRDSEDEPKWKELYNKVHERSKIEKKVFLEKEIEYTQCKLQALQLERPASFKAEKKPEDKTLVDAFTPLSTEAEEAVDEALEGGSRSEILVTHDKSNIDVTRAVMQCLSPGVWLNDEVINVYMELLKERELREPVRFLNCHFFNTFFYNKLFKDKRSYDYKAIRRWTTQKKLGYSLSDCDKRRFGLKSNNRRRTGAEVYGTVQILVPIHQDIHWCLAVINIREKRLEYLDSLKGGDRAVLDVLARYITDEARDKDGKVLDASTWAQDFPKDIPEQMNGCDCGMFMAKYADFHSRGAPLQFTQDHMEYFRRKMVWEILDLKAT